MKKTSRIMAAGAALALSLSMASGAYAAETDYTVESMLNTAIQDEYKALAEYEALVEVFDVARPFTNIMKAEERHIDALLPLFEAYGFEVPVNDAKDHAVIPESLAETYAIGIQAEIDNIAIYKDFLENGEVPEDVALVFENLMKASEHHLAAFERGLERVEGGIGGGSQRAAAARGSQMRQGGK